MCVTTDQTAGEVIQMGELQAEAPRKMRGSSPGCQVVKLLQEAELPETELQEAELRQFTQQLGTDSSSKNTFPSPG